MQWLQERLGDYRFVRALDRAPGKPWRFEFEDVADPAQRVLATWDPTEVGKGEARSVSLEISGKALRAERLTIAEGEVARVTVEAGMVELGARGYPVLVWFEDAR